MNENAMSDSSRMFSLLSALCQSPISWYTSGPAQKYILRQIKAIDSGKMVLQTTDAIRGTKQDGTEPSEGESKLDVCLLMLYGHILFTSTSFTFAMSMSTTGTPHEPSELMKCSIFLASSKHRPNKPNGDVKFGFGLCSLWP